MKQLPSNFRFLFSYLQYLIHPQYPLCRYVSSICKFTVCWVFVVFFKTEGKKNKQTNRSFDPMMAIAITYHHPNLVHQPHYNTLGAYVYLLFLLLETPRDLL